MLFLVMYAIFALTTALFSTFAHFVPALRQKQLTHDVHDKAMLYVVFFLASLLFAPMSFFSCIIPSMSERYIDGIYKGLFTQAS